MAVHIRKSRALRLRMASVRSENESPMTAAPHHEKKGHERQLRSERSSCRSGLKTLDEEIRYDGRKTSHINEPNNDDTLRGVMERSDTDRSTECHKDSEAQPPAVGYKENTDGPGVTQSTSHIVELAQEEYNIKETKKPFLSKTRYVLRIHHYLILF